MKRFFMLSTLVLVYLSNYGQIIADHRIVDKYAEIPQQWIDSVKNMWISIQGASHAEAYRSGVQRLSNINSKYPANGSTWTGPPPEINTGSPRLRVSGTTWGSYTYNDGWRYMHGQKDWWTNDLGRARIKAHLKYCHDNGYPLFANFYGWSYDAQFDNEPSGGFSPVYHTRWAGSTREGPDGNKVWGLTSADNALTGNRVCMDTYIQTINEFIQYCSDNNIPTKIIFATGPVEDNGTQGWNTGERGYQQFLKWQHIRKYVSTKQDAYFMDYADILSYNDAGEASTTTWVDKNGTTRTFPLIHPENLEGGDIGHIGYNGAVKLGKAMWWLLARMAGWDGGNTSTNSVTMEQPDFRIVVNENSLEVFFDEKQSLEQLSLQNVHGQIINKKVVKDNYCLFETEALPSGIYMIVSSGSVSYKTKKVFIP